jgi:hypothetical protein
LGFDGAIGTFTVCVLNYISFNYAGPVDNTSPIADGVPLVMPDVATPDTENMEPVDLPEVQVSPNPVSDQLDVLVQQTDESRVIALRMMDISGKTMISQEVEPVNESEFRYSMDVSNIQPGLYVLQVQTTKGMIAEKVTVVR